MGERFKLIIAEASLELVPKEIWGHPAVYKAARKRGKKPGETLLDSALHHQAMKRLSDSAKRGRPDIVHIELLEALESPLNKQGLLNVFVHTLEEYVIFINPETRLPRNYNRFVGLIEQLLTLGQVPPNSTKPLMYVKPMKLQKLLEEIGSCKAIAVSDIGEKISFRELAAKLANEPCTAIIIKGFTHAEFSQDVLSLVNEVYAPMVHGLEPWIHLSYILAHLADIVGIT